MTAASEKDLMVCVYIEYRGGQPLPPSAKLTNCGIEVVTNRRRLRELATRCLDPSPLEMGIERPLFFVEIATGNMIAVVPTDLLVTFRRERRQQGPCPVCGDRIQLVADSIYGHLIGSCGDGFTRTQWRALGPRRKTALAAVPKPGQPSEP